jgi:hypothetical protein
MCTSSSCGFGFVINIHGDEEDELFTSLDGVGESVSGWM